MQQQSILIVDDDPQLIEILTFDLEEEGFKVSSSLNGEDALKMVEKQAPDLVILDIMMPEMDGKEVCKRICSSYSVPVIMLSGRHEVSDKLECLKMGADDYITKPFDEKELVARIKAVLRRNNPDVFPSPLRIFESNSLKIDFLLKEVILSGNKIALTRTEFCLLQELVFNTGKTLSYDHLLHRVWGPAYGREREYLHVYIGHLRSKIEADPENPKYIVTVYGTGYRFDGN